MVTALHACAPIGVFDSGIGGLSVLRVLRQWLPRENWVYFADSAHAPYGEKSIDYVINRSLAITQQMIERHAVKALVVACNTATAEAIHVLRAAHPDLAIVGIEPGIKPALNTSQTKKIGIMATRRTVGSQKFQRLLKSMESQADFIVKPCDGLALAIEQEDTLRIQSLVSAYTNEMGCFGNHPDEIDTLVLGCTHYPLAIAQFRHCIGDKVTLVDPGAGVSKQLVRLLQRDGLLSGNPHAGNIITDGTSNIYTLELAINRWCHPNASTIS